MEVIGNTEVNVGEPKSCENYKRRHSSDECCAFWLAKKKRFCKTPPVSGTNHCAGHTNHVTLTTNEKHDESIDKIERVQLGLITRPMAEIEDGCVCAIHQDFISDNVKTDNSSFPINHIANIAIPGSGHSCDAPKTRTEIDSGRPIPKPDQCHFWMDRKRRYCKMRVATAAGQDMCVEHSSANKDGSGRLRIPCPNDPYHSCYAEQLQRHLSKCNSRPQLLPVFYVEGINSGNCDVNVNEKIRLHDVNISEVFYIIELIKKLHAELPEIRKSIEFHEALREEINKEKNGAEAQRHLVQQASLVGNMMRLGLLRDGCHYVEFGAGKGGLSHWVQLANKNSVDCQYMLLDKSSVRYKKDSFHRGPDQGPHFERIKIDIENLHLANVASLKSKQRSLVCMGKHLCGGATDLMLRCITNGSEETQYQDEKFYKHVTGVALALCCHHRCDWKCYVGKDWFVSRGLGPREFSLVVSMSAWATCGTRHITTTADLTAHDDENDVTYNVIDDKSEKDHTASRDEKCNPATLATSTNENPAINYNHPRYGTLLPEQREQIGIQCKQILDAGRLDYLLRHGFKDASLVYYTDRKFTLENMAIFATSSHSPTCDT